MSGAMRSIVATATGATASSSPARLTEHQRTDRIAELREEGKTYEQIGAALGLSGSNISWICLKYGIDGPKKAPLGDRGPMVMKRGNFEVRKFSPEDDAKIIAMTLDGANLSQVARALGRKRNSVLGRQMTLARREERAMEES